MTPLEFFDAVENNTIPADNIKHETRLARAAFKAALAEAVAVARDEGGAEIHALHIEQHFRMTADPPAVGPISAAPISDADIAKLTPHKPALWPWAARIRAEVAARRAAEIECRTAVNAGVGLAERLEAAEARAARAEDETAKLRGWVDDLAQKGPAERAARLKGFNEGIEAAAALIETHCIVTTADGGEVCPRKHGNRQSVEYAPAIRALTRSAPATRHDIPGNPPYLGGKEHADDRQD